MRENLIKCRKKNKLTQENISKMLGIGRSTYNAYELGTINPPLKIALKIKEILNYKNDDIFLNENVSETDGNINKKT